MGYRGHKSRHHTVRISGALSTPSDVRANEPSVHCRECSS